MISVRRLVWDLWNIRHIARHGVSPEEVEEICHKDSLVLRGQQKNRLVIIGKTEEKRILAVILESKGNNAYYVVTAYPADNKDKRYIKD